MHSVSCYTNIYQPSDFATCHSGFGYTEVRHSLKHFNWCGDKIIGEAYRKDICGEDEGGHFEKGK